MSSTHSQIPSNSAASRHRWLLYAGSIFSLLSVVIGAFAAHGLKAHLDAGGLALIETAARYQMYHGLALLICGSLAMVKNLNSSWVTYTGCCWAAGICLFSGALYLIALTQIKAFGMIAPLGGMSFVLGWLGMMMVIKKFSKLTESDH